MGLIKVTFNASNVTAENDSTLYNFLLNQNGILRGVKEECKATNNNNRITFKEGYLSIFGRMILIENDTSITIPLNSNAKGNVVVEVNLALNTVNLTYKEEPSTYPNLQQEDLTKTNGIYEFALCGYSKTSTSLTLDNNFKPNFIERKLDNKFKTTDKDKILNIDSKGDVVLTANSDVKVGYATKDSKGNVIDTTYSTKSENNKLKEDLLTEIGKKANSATTYNKTEVDSKDTSTLNSAKTYADTKKTEAVNTSKTYTDTQLKTITNNLTAEVVCAHSYEITGNTGDEHGLAVEDQQMIIKKIEGQTKVVNGNLVNSNCVLKSSGRNLIDISKYSHISPNVQIIDEKTIIDKNTTPNKYLAIALFTEEGSYSSSQNFNTLFKLGSDIKTLRIVFTDNNNNNSIVQYDVRNLKGFTIGIFADISSDNKKLSNVRVMVKNLPYEPYKEDTVSSIGSLGQWDYIQGNKKLVQTSDIVTLNGSENWSYNPNSTNKHFNVSIAPHTTDSSIMNINIVTNKLENVTTNKIFNGSTDNSISMNGSYVNIVKKDLTSVEQLKQWLASNPIQLVYKLATPTITEVSLPSGYAVYNGGLQSQVGDVPYKITKQYNLSQKAQILANVEIDREQQALIDNTYNKTEVDSKVKVINTSLTDNVNSLNISIGSKANQTSLDITDKKLKFVMENFYKTATKIVSGRTGAIEQSGVGFYAIARTTILPNLEKTPTIASNGLSPTPPTINYNKATGECECGLYGPKADSIVAATITYEPNLLQYYENLEQITLEEAQAREAKANA